jgi:pantothenate kinase
MIKGVDRDNSNRSTGMNDWHLWQFHGILNSFVVHRSLVIGFVSIPLTTYRKRAEIPIYSFAKHARQEETTSIYSPHVLILEGIFALYDPRVLDLLDMRVKQFLLQKVDPADLNPSDFL